MLRATSKHAMPHLLSSTSMSRCYHEKHRSTLSLHRTSRTTFKPVRSGHKRTSDTTHSSGHQKRGSQYFEAHLHQCVEVEVVMCRPGLEATGRVSQSLGFGKSGSLRVRQTLNNTTWASCRASCNCIGVDHDYASLACSFGSLICNMLLQVCNHFAFVHLY